MDFILRFPSAWIILDHLGPCTWSSSFTSGLGLQRCHGCQMCDNFSMHWYRKPIKRETSVLRMCTNVFISMVWSILDHSVSPSMHEKSRFQLPFVWKFSVRPWTDQNVSQDPHHVPSTASFRSSFETQRIFVQLGPAVLQAMTKKNDAHALQSRSTHRWAMANLDGTMKHLMLL